MTSPDESLPPAVERSPPQRLPLIAFTLFASYCLAANLAIALHELGHAMGCWLAGGRILGLVLGPQGYSGSYAARDMSVEFATPHGYLMLVAGGAVFGAAFGVLFLFAAQLFQRGSIGWIVTHATGTWCIGNNGAYLLLGSLYPFSDALFLIEEGVPRWALFLAGLLLVVAFLVLFASFLRGIGVTRDDSYWRWVLVVEAGLLGYLALIVVLRLLWPPELQGTVMPNELAALALSPVLLWLLATCTYALRHVARRYESLASEPSWMKAAVVLALGLAFMAAEIRFFSYDYGGTAAAQSVGQDAGAEQA